VTNWLDSPQSLWGSGSSSYEFVNNRVPGDCQER
jgi:hypothetical protein